MGTDQYTPFRGKWDKYMKSLIEILIFSYFVVKTRRVFVILSDASVINDMDRFEKSQDWTT